jgi:hypothetical protein
VRGPLLGPVVVYEKSGLPYFGHQFRAAWREVADAAGVPKEIKNMDSVAGGNMKLESRSDLGLNSS